MLTSMVVVCWFDYVQHFDRRLDGGFGLDGIQPAGLELLAARLPRDDRLHEGIGSSAGRDRDGVVAQHRELAAELVLVDLPERPHEGVVLAVADRGPLVFAAVDLEKEEGAKWLKDCRIWMYRGAWAEWEIENIEMAVPISPEELRAKRNSILKHQSQMESAPFLGNDERLFWQRSEDRNRGTAALYDNLGLASYEAMEAFVEYIPL